jgi:hypothetical protein
VEQSSGETYCLEQGGHLAAYTSAVEQNEVEQFYVKHVRTSHKSECNCYVIPGYTHPKAAQCLLVTGPGLQLQQPAATAYPPAAHAAAARQPAGLHLVRTHSYGAMP